MTAASAGGLHVVGGSFRDPDGRVFEQGDLVVRALSQRGLEAYEAVARSGFFRSALAAGDIVATRRASAEVEVELAARGWAGALEHERLATISHPYEWSFSMLRDAARLHLRLVRDALAEGIGCKDGSAYNVQFVGSRPVFIDVGSFAPGVERGWPGYRQFCQLFLFPLLVEAHLGTSFAPWLRGSIEGIALEDADRLLAGRHRLRRGVLAHVAAQAAIARRFADRPDDATGAVRSGSEAAVAIGLVDRLARTIDRLPAPDVETGWSDYHQRAHYEPTALAAKDQFVRQVVAEVQPARVVDLGCNDGRFSQVAADHGAQVVAVDSDRTVVDRLYRQLRGRSAAIVPLVADLADPSPALGWALGERSALPGRLHADLVLSLALVHHLIIGRNVPAGEVFDLLAGLAPEHVLELPHRSDPMVERLLAAKPDGTHLDYRRSTLRALVDERFEVVDELVLPGGTRTLLHLRRR